ncbi:MAG: class I SAM-dependent methyltransferase [Albidovulum sp.]
MPFTNLRLRDRQVFHGSRAKLLYELIGWHFRNASDLRFMNYGFAADDLAPPVSLRPEDKAEHYCSQLYHAVASQVDLSGAQVLDVGSGRGGGASYVHRYLRPKRTVGCDFAHSAIKFCENTYSHIPGLEFREGNAMALPFADSSFDVVLNVESSHCYPDRPAFLREVFRVLRPGGHFLYTDFTPPQIDPIASDAGIRVDLTTTGFLAIDGVDITQNIVRGLDRDSARRIREIGRRFPWGTRRMAQMWAGTVDSWIYRDFQTGARAYWMYRATRPDLSATNEHEIHSAPCQLSEMVQKVPA